MPVVPIRWVLIRDPHKKFAAQALLCTELTATPQQIVEWFVLRWQVEVTFEEARAHLGVETQRHWSDLAIVRTTPAVLGLYSPAKNRRAVSARIAAPTGNARSLMSKIGV